MSTLCGNVVVVMSRFIAVASQSPNAMKSRFRQDDTYSIISECDRRCES